VTLLLLQIGNEISCPSLEILALQQIEEDTDWLSICAVEFASFELLVKEIAMTLF